MTDDERHDLLTVADLLGLNSHDVDIAGRVAQEKSRETTRWGTFRLRPGDLVAFTGQMAGRRKEWERRAVDHGLTVSKTSPTRNTRLLVAADPDSLSGKASKARRYGIPIITTEAFEKLLAQMGGRAQPSPSLTKPTTVAP
ncbi:BRCT domain-containing protein [Actinophytocola sp.]|uniref:BRCT domain-containing protein n=1 Tax=Actinophytocola sp. TaxID=1872138 RepID=UPI0025C5D32E|nr:BRCT domain-containing protein [Actinophytocola sp.]